MRKFYALGLVALLVISLTACGDKNTENKNKMEGSEVDINMKEEISDRNVTLNLAVGDENMVITLEDNPTTQELLKMLPMTLEFSDYSGIEKIAYPTGKLSIEGAPKGYDPSVGDLALYAPWGNLVIYYKDFNYSSGLIRLGHFESGIDILSEIKGNFTATLDVVDE